MWNVVPQVNKHLYFTINFEHVLLEPFECLVLQQLVGAVLDKHLKIRDDTSRLLTNQHL